MKKILYLGLLIVCASIVLGCKRNPEIPMQELPDSLKNEKRASFNFFWELQATEKGELNYGLIPDRYPNNGLASIASVGFGLASIPIGVESGFITEKEGKERVRKSLESLLKLERKKGFYYHFYNYYTGMPGTKSEISVIDTGILICGALMSGEFFGGKIRSLAKKLYKEVDWNWYINPQTNQFYMSYDPKEEVFSGAWDFYAEQLMLYFLGAGSKTHPIEKVVYDSFKKKTGNYGGYQFIHSWFGSIFTYQFSHAFIDFRKLRDSNGIDWYQNSVNATLSAQKFAIDQEPHFRTLNQYAFGLTACDGPSGYDGDYGSAPSGNNNDEHKVDGTVPPAGAIGSLPFAPEIVLKSSHYYAALLEGALIGEYGFYDAFNLEKEKPWIAKDVIGIDKGVSLLMISNYENEFVWRYFMKCDFMKSAIEVLQFTEVGE